MGGVNYVKRRIKGWPVKIMPASSGVYRYRRWAELEFICSVSGGKHACMPRESEAQVDFGVPGERLVTVCMSLCETEVVSYSAARGTKHRAHGPRGKEAGGESRGRKSETSVT